MSLTLAFRLYLALFLSVVVNITLLLAHVEMPLTPDSAPRSTADTASRKAGTHVVASEGSRPGAPRHTAGRNGNERAYRISTPGVRWEPCTVIGWRYNPRGGYRGALRDLRRAFKVVARASRLRFRFEGTTSKAVARHHARDARTDILVSWETPRTVPALRRSVLALAYTSYFSSTRRYVAGRIALDRTESRIRPGFHPRGRADWGQVMTHEIGHVVGLDHVRNPTQNMNGFVSSRNHRLGQGDVAGMRRVGARRRCPS